MHLIRSTSELAKQNGLTSALLLIVCVAAGCAHIPASTTVVRQDKSCMSENATSICLLGMADSTLASVTDDFDWATSAADLALAHDSANDPAQAALLVAGALERAALIDDAKKRVAAYGDIATALAHIRPLADGLAFLEKSDRATADIDDINMRADVLGKIIAARAQQGDPHEALRQANSLPDDEGYQGVYKVLALRRIATALTLAGDFPATREAIAGTKAGMPYFQSVARSDAATAAAKSGEREFPMLLLDEALGIARAIDDGYFRSATLRDIAVSYHFLERQERSHRIFTEAVAATADAKTAQEQARSMSRIATSMSDVRLFAMAEEVITDSMTVAASVDTELLRAFVHYEIAGAAAFAGYFTTAREIVAEIPDLGFGNTSSIRSAAERDLAWGLARHGRLNEALAMANNIASDRERIQAISRIVRVINNPSMRALPRYL